MYMRVYTRAKREMYEKYTKFGKTKKVKTKEEKIDDVKMRDASFYPLCRVSF